MINKSKLALIAVVAATLGIASPAFAQSYNPGDGTGNVLPFAYGPGGAKQRSVVVAPELGQIAVRQSGANAYAMVPHSRTFYDYSPGWSGNNYDPATSGYDGGIETQR